MTPLVRCLPGLIVIALGCLSWGCSRPSDTASQPIHDPQALRDIGPPAHLGNSQRPQLTGSDCPQPPLAATNPTLVWQDEFEGSTLDRTRWGFDVGPGPWGLHELQAYTDGANIQVVDGMLVLEARKEAFLGRAYTSARLWTQQAFQFGRIEARIKLPHGQGVFPAFWMLTETWATPGQYGEIDILELVGSEAGVENATLWGSCHRPDEARLPEGLKSLSRKYVTPDRAWFSDAFHVFAVEWRRGEIRYFVDNTLFYTVKMKPNGSDGWSALQRPMFLILNLAIGGDWAGAPDDSTPWPVRMAVDYVRVYRF